MIHINKHIAEGVYIQQLFWLVWSSRRSSPTLAGTFCRRSARSESSYAMLTAKHSVSAPDRYRTSCWTDKEEHPNPRNPPKNIRQRIRLHVEHWVYLWAIPPSNFLNIFVSIVQKGSGALTKIALKCQKEAKAQSWSGVIGIHISGAEM